MSRRSLGQLAVRGSGSVATPAGTYQITEVGRREEDAHDQDWDDGYYYLLVGADERGWVRQNALAKAIWPD